MRILAVGVFLGVVFLILGLIHAFLYASMVTFFGISSSTGRKSLAIILGLLALSFVLTSIGVGVFPGTLSRLLYVVAAIWFGAALYLVLASALAWVAVAVVRWGPLQGRTWLPGAAAGILYLLAGLLVIHNLAGSHRVQVTRLTIELENLPRKWDGKTVAHLSDVHLGAYWDRGFLDSLVSRILELRPEIILITGDLFDGSSGGHQRFLPGLRRFTAPRGTYFVSGNHEVYAGLDRTLPVVREAGITVIDDRLVNLDGLQLIGIASPTFDGSGPPFDFAAHPDYDRERPSILLYHTPTDIAGTGAGAGGGSAYLSPEVSFRTAIAAEVSLQLSGHTHAGQFLPFTWLTERIYGGYHRGLKRIGGFQIFVHSGTGTWGAPFRSGSVSEIALITLERAPDGAPSISSRSATGS